MSTQTWAFRAHKLACSVGIRAPRYTCRWSGSRIQSALSMSTSSSMPPAPIQTKSKSSDFIGTTICLLLFGHGIYTLHKAVKERIESRREIRMIALLECYRASADCTYHDNLVPFGSYRCAVGYMREALWMYYVCVVGLSAMDVDRLFMSMLNEGEWSGRITPDSENKARIWDLCEGLRRELRGISPEKVDVDEASVYALAEIFNRYAMKFLKEAVALSELHREVWMRACLASVRAEEDAQELPPGDWRALE